MHAIHKVKSLTMTKLKSLNSGKRNNFSSIKASSNLAHAILNCNTPYFRQKQNIFELFKNFQIKNYGKKIELRLSIIDSHYSTNMNKRYFGIEDVAANIASISRNDSQLKNMFMDYIINPNQKGNENIKNIRKLFENNYGIKKSGEETGHAISLISKYAYFLCDFCFPIYDNLVKRSVTILRKNQSMNLPSLFTKEAKLYFKNISKINEITGIRNYNKLDNFLWLLGKVSENNYSLILNKKDYIKFLNYLYPNNNSQKISSKRIKKYFNECNHDPSKVIGKNLTDFIRYAIELFHK
jgi:hypothetical protein